MRFPCSQQSPSLPACQEKDQKERDHKHLPISPVTLQGASKNSKALNANKEENKRLRKTAGPRAADGGDGARQDFWDPAHLLLPCTKQKDLPKVPSLSGWKDPPHLKTKLAEMCPCWPRGWLGTLCSHQGFALQKPQIPPREPEAQLAPCLTVTTTYKHQITEVRWKATSCPDSLNLLCLTLERWRRLLIFWEGAEGEKRKNKT